MFLVAVVLEKIRDLNGILNNPEEIVICQAHSDSAVDKVVFKLLLMDMAYATSSALETKMNTFNTIKTISLCSRL